MSHPVEVEGLPSARTLDRRQQIRWIVYGAGALLLVLLLITAVQRLTKPVDVEAAAPPPGTFRPTADQLAQMKIETVGMGVDPGDVAATGTISVDEERSTPVVLPYSGQVADVFVEAGQHVTRGQPLMRIASSDFVDARDGLFSAAAQRATAAAQLRIAQENEQRQQQIFQTAGGARKDYQQAQSDLVAAQSAVRSADAALGAARDKLALLGKTPAEIGKLESVAQVGGIYSQTTYHAPVAGTVVARNVAPGQYVSAGGDKPLMTITDLASVWLVAQVDQTAAATVHLGDPVRVTTPAYPGRVFHAVIDNIGASLDPVSHRLPVRATVINPDEALKPEMFASFAIERRVPSSAILVPASAVIREGDSARVWVARRDGLLVSRPVTVSDSANGTVTISSGLNAGERIVTAGSIFVNEAGLGE